MTVNNIVLVEASDMTSEYNSIVLEMLKSVPGLERDGKLNIQTNSKIRTSHPVAQAFNLHLRRLQNEGNSRIIISL